VRLTTAHAATARALPVPCPAGTPARPAITSTSLDLAPARRSRCDMHRPLQRRPPPRQAARRAGAAAPGQRVPGRAAPRPARPPRAAGGVGDRRRGQSRERCRRGGDQEGERRGRVDHPSPNRAARIVGAAHAATGDRRGTRSTRAARAARSVGGGRDSGRPSPCPAMPDLVCWIPPPLSGRPAVVCATDHAPGASMRIVGVRLRRA